MADTTISVEEGVRDEINHVADRLGMKQKAVVAAMVRGWAMLTPEQQAKAIMPPVRAQPAGSGRRVDPIKASAELTREAANLNNDIVEAQADGVIDPAEQQKIDARLGQISSKRDEVAVAVSGK